MILITLLLPYEVASTAAILPEVTKKQDIT
jgi:hypothetical protein